MAYKIEGRVSAWIVAAALLLAACGSGGGGGAGSSPTAPPPSATPPVAPTGLSATPSSGQVALSWATDAGATGYNVYRGTSTGVTPANGLRINGTTPISVTSTVDSSVANGTPYYYIVTALDSAGESAPSAEVSATPPAALPPSAPTGLSVVGLDGQAQLSWNAVAGATGYNLYRSTVSGAGTAGIQIAAAGSPASDAGLSNETIYYYVVTALNGSGESGPSAEISVVPSKPWQAIAAADSISLGVRADGTLWQWGFTVTSTVSSTLPTQLGAASTWKSVSVSLSRQTAAALATDGSLWTWGSSQFAGFASPGSVTVPTQLGTDLWKAVSVGNIHTHAIRSDGTLWAWGANAGGALGIGSFGTTAALPVQQVGTDTNWKIISAGNNFTVAIRTDGTLWAWGGNSLGNLGLGDTTARNAPAQIGTDKDWSAVSASNSDVLALKTNGSLWAWGGNGEGKLGIGDISPSTCGITPCAMSPVQVGTDMDWKAVAAENTHTVAVKTNGTLWSWGSNASGAVGVGAFDNANYTTPQQIGSATNWQSVTAGVNFSLALRTDGTLWSWGINNAGNLGTGDKLSQSSPVQVR